MSNEPKHTPTPWRFCEEEFKIKGTGDIEGRTVIANLSPKMDFSRGSGTQYQNAARIVQCVNEYDGLIETIESLRAVNDELIEALRHVQFLSGNDKVNYFISQTLAKYEKP